MTKLKIFQNGNTIVHDIISSEFVIDSKQNFIVIIDTIDGYEYYISKNDTFIIERDEED